MENQLSVSTKHVPVEFTCDEEKQSWFYSSVMEMLNKYIFPKRQYPNGRYGLNYIIIVYLSYILIIKNKTSKKMTQISKTFIFILTIFQWTFGTVIQIKLPDGKELIKIFKKQQPKPDFTRIYTV